MEFVMHASYLTGSGRDIYLDVPSYGVCYPQGVIFGRWAVWVNSGCMAPTVWAKSYQLAAAARPNCVDFFVGDLAITRLTMHYEVFPWAGPQLTLALADRSGNSMEVTTMLISFATSPT